MKTDTLDAQLRQRGFEQLDKEIKDSFYHIERWFHGSGNQDVVQHLVPPDKRDGITAKYAYDVMEVLKKMARRTHENEYGQRAVNEFLKEFDRIKNDIESLQTGGES